MGTSFIDRYNWYQGKREYQSQTVEEQPISAGRTTSFIDRYNRRQSEKKEQSRFVNLQSQRVSTLASSPTDPYAKYYGKSSAELQTELDRLENEGAIFTTRAATDDEIAIEAGRLDKAWSAAESAWLDADAMYQAGSLPEYYTPEYIAGLSADLDAITAERDAFYSGLSSTGGWNITEVTGNKYQDEIDWLTGYIPSAEYSEGSIKFGYELTEMKPYEILDLKVTDPEEQTWIDEYVANAVVKAGMYGRDEYEAVAESQRFVDNLYLNNEQEILLKNATTSYRIFYNPYVFDIGGNNTVNATAYLNDLRAYATSMGISEEEAKKHIVLSDLYFATTDAAETKEDSVKFAREHPFWASVLAAVEVPSANLYSTFALAKELLGSDVYSTDPLIYSSKFVDNHRSAVGSDIASGETGMFLGVLPVVASEGPGVVNYKGKDIFNGNAGKWVYDTINDAVDSIAGEVFAKGIGGNDVNTTSNILSWTKNIIFDLLSNSEMTFDEYVRLKQQGVDDTKALGGAFVMTAIDLLVGRIGDILPLERVVNKPNTLVNLWKQFSDRLRQTIGGEWLAALANQYFIDGDKSFSDRCRALKGLFVGYKAAGFEDKEAFRQAWREILLGEETAEAFKQGIIDLIIETTGLG